MQSLFIYGPPGSGKTTLGKSLAGRFHLPFTDLDAEIVRTAGRTVPEIFAAEGESGFRQRESDALAAVEPGLVALGGGALLSDVNRTAAASRGTVLCLDVPPEELKTRIAAQKGTRPLADEADKLERLLAVRAPHYASFPVSLTARFTIDSGDEPSDILVGRGLLDTAGLWAAFRQMGTRAVLVCDTHTRPLYGARVQSSLAAAGFDVTVCEIPAGEKSKTVTTVGLIWRACLSAGLGRGDCIVSLGGGVAGDLSGFAASTWMRGIRWINIPTTLLAMVDASTGGKTGFDLPEAKNMIGAFHSPTFVLADTDTLTTLPSRETGCGLAESVKHALIADPGLTDALAAGITAQTVARSLAVKVRIVTEDAKEKGVRAKLNLGHTVGHAVEIATDFSVKHGEAVAVGTAEEARLAVRLGLAPADWPDRVAAAFASVGLPTALPEGLTFDALIPLMKRDKKKADGSTVVFALPCAPGDVRLVPVTL